MVNEPPKVAPDGRYPIGQAAELLGIGRTTLRRHADRGPRNGGIAFTTPKGSTKKYFSGRDILAYWRRRTGA